MRNARQKMTSRIGAYPTMATRTKKTSGCKNGEPPTPSRDQNHRINKRARPSPNSRQRNIRVSHSRRKDRSDSNRHRGERVSPRGREKEDARTESEELSLIESDSSGESTDAGRTISMAGETPSALHREAEDRERPGPFSKRGAF